MTNSEFRDTCHKSRIDMRRWRRVSGVTLIELMVGIALIAILAALAVPSFNEFRQRATLRGAVEQYSSALAEVRNEAIKQNIQMTVDFTAITANLPADVSVISAATMKDSAGTAGKVTINPRDGMLVSPPPPSGNPDGNLVLGIGSYQLRFKVTLLGRSSVCAPSGHSVPGYKDCAP